MWEDETRDNILFNEDNTMNTSSEDKYEYTDETSTTKSMTTESKTVVKQEDPRSTLARRVYIPYKKETTKDTQWNEVRMLGIKYCPHCTSGEFNEARQVGETTARCCRKCNLEKIPGQL